MPGCSAASPTACCASRRARPSAMRGCEADCPCWGPSVRWISSASRRGRRIAALRASLGLLPEHLVIGITRAGAAPPPLRSAARGHGAGSRARCPRRACSWSGAAPTSRRRPAAPRRAWESPIASIFAGYRSADYPDVLRASDVFTLLVPGSDGSCRALLEAAACGIPAVTTGLGTLPEIVSHGETGFVVEAEPDRLAAAWRSLLENAALRRDVRRGRAPARRALLLARTARGAGRGAVSGGARGSLSGARARQCVWIAPSPWARGDACSSISSR